jgi:hypothetical protein
MRVGAATILLRSLRRAICVRRTALKSCFDGVLREQAPVHRQDELVGRTDAGISVSGIRREIGIRKGCTVQHTRRIRSWAQSQPSRSSRGATSVVLDSGAFIVFEKNDRKVRTLIELALAHSAPLWTAGAVVARVWRDGSRQARLARLLGSGLVQVQPLDRDGAQATGVLCGEAGTKDVVDASVALVAALGAAVSRVASCRQIAGAPPQA